jgi:RNA polymerase sigma-B factor
VNGSRPGQRGGYDHLAPLFAELAALPRDHRQRQELRQRLVTEHLPVAEHIATRFSHPGEPVEDLTQVATVGLINAVDRFDPDRGADFLSFAIPTIMGEIRRYIRDTSWAVRVPRRLKELRLAIDTAVSELSQQLGRAPTPSSIAEHLGLTKEEVYEGLEAMSAHHSLSLDRLLTEEPDGPALSDTLGECDADLETVVDRESLHPLLMRLPERERRIVALRFFENLTQTQIAERIGISQMHVSRLLTKSLDQLRGRLTTGDDAPPPGRTRSGGERVADP